MINSTYAPEKRGVIFLYGVFDNGYKDDENQDYVRVHGMQES